MDLSRPSFCAAGLLLSLASAFYGCGSPSTPPAISTGDSGPDQADGGEPDASRPNPRPDGGPRLPQADDETVLPLGESAVYRIETEAGLGRLDVQLSIDTTSSFSGEINALQRDLSQVILPGLRDRVPDLSIGVARFEDFPAMPFGSEGDPPFVRADRPFELLVPITSDETNIARAVAELDMPLGLGGDIPEAGSEALWLLATGRGYELDGETLVEPYDGVAEPGGGNLGGVGFRESALHVVLHVTDAPSHSPESYGAKFPDTHDWQDTIDALEVVQARVVSVVTGFCERGEDDCSDQGPLEARAELESLAIATRADTAPDEDGKCPHGIDGGQLDAVEGRDPEGSSGARCPLVFDASSDGDGLSEVVVDAIASLVDGIRFERVTAIASDDPLGLVERISPLPVRDSPEIEDLLPEGAPDGELDTFVDARSEARLAFEVHLRNDRVAPREFDQVFRIVLRIFGDDLIIEERILRVVIPAGATPAPDDDAGG